MEIFIETVIFIVLGALSIQFFLLLRKRVGLFTVSSLSSLILLVSFFLVPLVYYVIPSQSVLFNGVKLADQSIADGLLLSALCVISYLIPLLLFNKRSSSYYPQVAKPIIAELRSFRKTQVLALILIVILAITQVLIIDRLSVADQLVDREAFINQDGRYFYSLIGSVCRYSVALLVLLAVQVKDTRTKQLLGCVVTTSALLMTYVMRSKAPMIELFLFWGLACRLCSRPINKLFLTLFSLLVLITVSASVFFRYCDVYATGCESISNLSINDPAVLTQSVLRTISTRLHGFDSFVLTLDQGYQNNILDKLLDYLLKYIGFPDTQVDISGGNEFALNVWGTTNANVAFWLPTDALISVGRILAPIYCFSVGFIVALWERTFVVNRYYQVPFYTAGLISFGLSEYSFANAVIGFLAQVPACIFYSYILRKLE